MKIKSLKIRKIKVPFVITFKHALNSSEEVESVILEITLNSGEVGYGECVPRIYVTGETVDSVVTVLKNSIGPKLLEQSFSDEDEVLQFLSDYAKHFPAEQNALCAQTCVELALLDAIGKKRNTHVLSLLGGPKGNSEIHYSAVISAGDPRVIEKMLLQGKELGFSQLKLKVGKDLAADLKNLRRCKEILGEALETRIDANAGWSLEEALKVLPEFAEAGVISCEQAMPKGSSYSELFKVVRSSMHLSLDESLCSLDDGARIIRDAEADVFNLRVSKNGGLLNALKLHKMAKGAGLHSQLGAQVGETSLLSAAGRTLALLTGDLLFHEGSFGLMLLAFDLTDKPMQFGPGGKASLSFLKNPGLGVIVDAAKLEQMTLTSILV